LQEIELITKSKNERTRKKQSCSKSFWGKGTRKTKRGKDPKIFVKVKANLKYENTSGENPTTTGVTSKPKGSQMEVSAKPEKGGQGRPGVGEGWGEVKTTMKPKKELNLNGKGVDPLAFEDPKKKKKITGDETSPFEGANNEGKNHNKILEEGGHKMKYNEQRTLK